jgi:hypothetical protein
MLKDVAKKYMAEYTPGLSPTDAKFFKIWELGYDSATGMGRREKVKV